jgi:hypothetical protein
MLGHDWKPAVGTVVREDWMGERRKWIMDIQPDSGEPAFRTEVHEPDLDGDFHAPYGGQSCRMHCDVKKQKAKFDTSDPTLSRKARRQQEKQLIKDELAAGPGSGPGFAGGRAAARLQAGSTGYQVVSGADVAPVLNAIMGGHAQEGIAALRAMQAEQLRQAGVDPSAVFGGQTPQPAQPSMGAAPFSGAVAPDAPQPAQFGAPFQAEEQGVTNLSAPDLAGRLNKLQALLDQGLLTHSEYATQRQRILDSI